MDSLVAEREFSVGLRTQIAGREGVVLPIEKRTIRSISDAATAWISWACRSPKRPRSDVRNSSARSIALMSCTRRGSMIDRRPSHRRGLARHRCLPCSGCHCRVVHRHGRSEDVCVVVDPQFEQFACPKWLRAHDADDGGNGHRAERADHATLSIAPRTSAATQARPREPRQAELRPRVLRTRPWTIPQRSLCSARCALLPEPCRTRPTRSPRRRRQRSDDPERHAGSSRLRHRLFIHPLTVFVHGPTTAAEVHEHRPVYASPGS